MWGLLVLVFPFLLLAFLLIMERVERPLTRVAPERRIEDFLDEATPEELETFMREGTDPAMRRFQRRHHPAHRRGQGNL